MKITNIYNNKRKIYLFSRDDNGKQIITEDNSFFPYYYEKHPEGTATSIYGDTLKQIFCVEPRDVASKRSDTSFEADIPYTRRYMIDKVDELEECPIRWMMLDIEVLSRELPDYKNPKGLISSVSIYDNFTKSLQTWFLGDYKDKSLVKSEEKLLKSFVNYLGQNSPDILFAWNIAFDYNYLQARIKAFAKEISPINMIRIGERENNIFYPAGISIVDYMTLFKKVYMREQSYRLDAIAQKYLGEEAWKETRFGELNDDIKDKNINDVLRLKKLEEKFNLVPYYNEIRLLSKCQWEDLPYNTRIVEMLLFEEAKKKKLILPNKKGDVEKEEFQGAAREAEQLGVSFGVYKHDLSSAYPSMIRDFCLDNMNISLTEEPNSIKIENTYFIQNRDTLLPNVISKLLDLKDLLKIDRDSCNMDSPEYEQAKIKYDAIKAVTNSAYGAFGSRFFRLYDKRIASATTYLVRNLLEFIVKKVETSGRKVLYYDTDSTFIKSNENINDFLNSYIEEWAKGFGKTVHISFEFEGIFEKLLILKKCRYFGLLKSSKGLKEEIKGIEVKRSDSSKFMAEFQRKLIYKILEGTTQDEVVKWIISQAEELKKRPLEEIAFPCKIGKKEENYKNQPIFLRALEYSKDFVNLDKVQGEIFYYIYVKPFGYEEDSETAYYLGHKRILEPSNLTKEEKEKLRTRTLKPKKPKNVMAFDKDNKAHIKEVDYEAMIERNILTKSDVIFEALGWDNLALRASVIGGGL